MRNFLMLVGLLVVFEVDKKGKTNIIYSQGETSKTTCEKEVYVEEGDYGSDVCRRTSATAGANIKFKNGEMCVSTENVRHRIGFQCLDISLKDAKTYPGFSCGNECN
jgi:hypothetical protein